MKWIVDADTMAELQRRNDEPRQARAIAAPDSWPWPMSSDAQWWVKQVERMNDPIHKTGVGKPVGEQFDKQAHEEFLKSLG